MKNLVILLMFLLASCAPAVTVRPTKAMIQPTEILKLSPVPTKSTTIRPMATKTNQAEYYEFFPSPDGQRILRGIKAPDANSFDVMKDGRVEWELLYNNSDLLNAEYNPFFWSQDGKYLYLSIHESMDGGFGGFYSGSGISRLELKTGNITQILPASGMLAFAFSPDESQIAYIKEYEKPLMLKTYDLNTQTEKKLLVFDKNVAQAGSIGWSPKMDKLIFMTMEIKNEQTSDYLFGISILDLKNLKTSSLIKNFDRSLTFESWTDEAQVFYTDWDDTVWQLDLISKLLSAKEKATLTP